MLFLFFKAMHLIGMVAWFAGLFYLVRVLVYHAEAMDKPPLEKDILVAQFTKMENLVFKVIAYPAMWFTLVFGVAMLIKEPTYLQMNWMHLKLGFVGLLVGYTFYCKKLMKEVATKSPTQLRMLNEVPTLFLIAIVLLAIFKTNLNAVYLFAAILLLAVLFYMIIKKYKRYREANKA